MISISSVELRNFPPWTEVEDLIAVLEMQSGRKADHVSISWDSSSYESFAVATFKDAAVATEVAAQLMGFEFTPGYPLVAVPKTGNAIATVGYFNSPQGGKGGASGTKHDESLTDAPSDCIGLGYIEGWFASSKKQVDERGWGHVQSYSFDGNLTFRSVYCPLIATEAYKMSDPVSFEVVEAVDGRRLAVNLHFPDKHTPPDPESGSTPWLDSSAHELECYIAENKRWLKDDGEELLRGFQVEDQRAVFAEGPLTGRGEPRKILFSRINRHRAKMGIPFLRGDGRDEEQVHDYHAWGRKRQRMNAAEPVRDYTSGSKEGTVVWFAGFDPDIDLSQLQAHAEWAGMVKHVEIFTDRETGEKRPCGKVVYGDSAAAQYAILSLHRTELNGRILTVQPLGGSSSTKVNPGAAHYMSALGAEEAPASLPLCLFSDSQTDDEKCDIICGAFEELVQNTGPDKVAWMARNLVKEANNILDGNNDAKKGLVKVLGLHPWFWENQQQIRFQPSKGMVAISKISPSQKKKDWNAVSKYIPDELKKPGAGKGKGKHKYW